MTTLKFKTQVIRKLSNFNFQWTKTLYQNNLIVSHSFYIFQVKFHKNCENTGKILKISCVRCHFMKCDVYFLGL